jgi:hypothetical protein
MASTVFANNREVSCKAANGKTICALPDVCFTPPENPATPPGVPVPYPNTGMASDTTDGSKTVKIGGKEVGLKDKSCFKKSMGDEAGCAAKKGVITSQNRGKVYFKSWSMDVKIEGENAVRHLDLTTSNHASDPGDTPPWPYIDSMSVSSDPCADEKSAEQTACSKHGGDRSKECADPDCQTAQACKLVPYGGKGSPNCCPDKTGHHLVEVNCFTEPSGRGGLRQMIGEMSKQALGTALTALRAVFSTETPHTTRIPLRGFADYDEDAAPTVCADTEVGYTDHGAMHTVTERAKRRYANADILDFFGQDMDGNDIVSRWTYDDASSAGAKAHHTVHPQCSEKCTKAQLDAYHTEVVGIEADTPVRTDLQSYPQGAQWLRDNRSVRI